MLLVKPSVKILSITLDPLGLIEKAGRTCYKSEDNIGCTAPNDRCTNNTHICGGCEYHSSSKFATMILKRGHESVIEHASATVRFVCDRGVTHEIVRHRLASYSQESTRYCDYGKMGIRFIVPGDFDLDEDDLALLQSIEDHYNKCLAKGRSPQQARYFLPNGLKTEIVMTANLREWRYFFKLRTSVAAHPQMREVAIPLLAEMKNKIPIIFDDL